MTDAITTPGTVIDGRFRVETILGEGAVGQVVKALHLEVGTHVALKFLLPRMQADPVVVERFAREARASSLITSEHVARVFDVGQTPETGPYIVMEYLSGETVSDALKRLRMLPVDLACAYMIQVCEALSEAHARGIIHRDLKPANLFITSRNGKPMVKVLDFGISKLGGEAISVGDGELTMASTILGTPLYMAPEQIASSRTVDGRADIWSCGICLHRMLCGVVPFDADSLPALGAKLLTTKAPNLNRLRPAVPRELAAVVLRCLERDMDQRWQTADELADALQRFAGMYATSARSEPLEDHSVATIAIVPRSEAETSADLTREAAQARAYTSRRPESEMAEGTVTALNEPAPLGVQRRSQRPSPPPPRSSGRGGFEEEIPTMRLSSPPVAPEPHRRTSRPPAAGAPHHHHSNHPTYPNPPQPTGRSAPPANHSGSVNHSSHAPSHGVNLASHSSSVPGQSGSVAGYSGSVPGPSGGPAYHGGASHRGNASGGYPVRPTARNSRNAPTVRGTRRRESLLRKIENHPYFGVGLVVLVVVVLLLMFVFIR